MRARISTLLLAGVAMASIAVAVVRIANATGDHRDSVQKQVRVYGTTAALAAETRRKLRPPLGFQRSSDCHVDRETVCFTRSNSLLLNVHVVGRLLAALGATLYSADRAKSGVPPIGCRTASVRFRLSFQSCDAEALIGPERLRVSVKSAVHVVHGSLRPTTRSVKGFAYPTEIHVFVIGHFLDTGAP
jgi:hypothetical protein